MGIGTLLSLRGANLELGVSGSWGLPLDVALTTAWLVLLFFFVYPDRLPKHLLPRKVATTSIASLFWDSPGTRKYCVCLASALRLTSLWVRVAEPRDGVSILCLFHPDWLDLGAIRGDPSFLGGCLIPGGRDEPRGPLLSAPPRALGLDSLLAAIRTGSTKYLTNSPSLICRVSG